MASARLSRSCSSANSVLASSARGLRRRQRRLQGDRQPLRPLDQAVLLQARQAGDVIVQRRDLERDRARIVGIEHRQVAHRRQRRADQIARAIGDLAIDQRQQDVEVFVAGFVIGELPREARGVDGALDAAAHVEEAPAGGAIHVFLRQAGEACQFLQRQFGGADDAVVVVDLQGEALHHLGDDLPGVGRKPLAQRASRYAAPIAPATAPSRICPRLCSASATTFAGLVRVACEVAPQVTRSRWIRSTEGSAVDDPLPGSRIGVAERADQPQRRLGALEIAAEPEQIVGGAARHHAGDAPDPHRVGGRQQRRSRDRLVGEHPDIRRPRAVAHRDGAGIGLFGDPAEAAGHDGPAVGRCGGEHPQHERARREPALLPHRRRRQPHQLLADIIDAAIGDRALCSRSRSAGDNSPASTGPLPEKPGTARP